MIRVEEEDYHTTFMFQTLRLAERALKAGELPIGAMLVLNDQVVAEAYCADKQRSMLAHPELLALHKADQKDLGLDARRQTALYTTLEPCLMCLGAAMSFCVGQIVYGASAPADGAATRLSDVSFGDGSYPDYKMPTIVGGVLADESRALFEAFIRRSSDRTLIKFAKGIVES